MKVWLLAARPRTLPAAVSPVLVGTAASGHFNLWAFLLAMIVSLAIQVGVNFANDLFDAKSGVDTAERVGPQRAVSAGMVTPSAMKRAIAVSFGIAAVAGLLLTLRVGPEILVVGALSFLAALGYSGGPRPYASAGLGELFVFVFFGLVATVGSAYVQVDRLTALAFVAAVPVGFLASAILVVNNLRDIKTDEAAGKRTLAVRLGPKHTRFLYRALLTGSFACLPLIVIVDESPAPMLALWSIAVALDAGKVVKSEDPDDLIEVLAATALLQLLFCGLLALGLWIS
jgi:1,4-dihydroxy-2-naphthoate octaprenyltransferase